MEIYLLRHGEAEPRYRDDPQRSLTPQGRVDVESVATQFASRLLPLAHCYYSPYLRTTQTAELFLATAQLSVKAESLKVLTPEQRAKDVLKFLGTLPVEQVLLVTHNPLVSELLALLTSGDVANMPVFATSELNAVECAAVGLAQGSWRFRLQANG